MRVNIMSNVEWYLCKGGIWCNLFKLDTGHKYLESLEGVYVIWTGETGNLKVLMVGHGSISQELGSLKKELAMQAFAHIGAFVTWAEVPSFKRIGIANYLTFKLHPSMSGADANGSKTEVNLPWDKPKS